MQIPQFTIQNILEPPPKKHTLKFSEEKIHINQGIQLHQKAEGVLLNSFIGVILGNPGSGKSTMLQQFLLNNEFFGKRFERVIFIGPTIYKKLIQDEHNTKSSLDIGWLFSKIEEANQWKCSSMLIIMDDVISSMKSCSNQDFINLFYNRRHLLQNGVISIMLSAQKWNMVPTFIRGAYSMVICFAIAKTQVQILSKELSTAIPKKMMMELVQNLKKHEFIFFNLQLGKIFNSQWTQI